MSCLLWIALTNLGPFRQPVGSFQKGPQSENLLLNPRKDKRIGWVTATIKQRQLT